MKSLIAIVMVLSIISVADAATVTVEQLKACETALKDKNKADKAAAPEGFKPDHPRGYRVNFIADCLSK